MLRSAHSLIALATTFAVVGLAADVGHAAIAYVANSTYTENFDSRFNTQQANDSTFTFVDDTANNGTIPGFYAYQGGGGSGSAFGTAGPATAGNITSGLSSTSAVLTSWRGRSGSSPNFVYSNDASFGTQNFGANTATNNSIYYGIALTNTASYALTEFTLGYNFELWSSNGATAVDGLAVSYALGATGVADSHGTWNATTLGVSVPIATNTTNTAGTLAGGSITGILWQPGQTLFIRWADTNVSGNDRGMSIDDLTFTATPEPASLAALGLLAAVGVRRRSR